MKKIRLNKIEWDASTVFDPKKQYILVMVSEDGSPIVSEFMGDELQTELLPPEVIESEIEFEDVYEVHFL